MTEAPEFKPSLNLPKKKSQTQTPKSHFEELELFQHDMLTSLHAIRLGVSQLKFDGENLDLISAIEDELELILLMLGRKTS